MSYNWILSLSLLLPGCVVILDQDTPNRTVQETLELDHVLQAWYNTDLPRPDIQCVESFKWYYVNASKIAEVCNVKNAIGCTSWDNHVVLITDLDEWPGDYHRIMRHEAIHMVASCAGIDGDRSHNNPRLWSDTGGYWPLDLNDPQWENFQKDSVEWQAFLISGEHYGQ